MTISVKIGCNGNYVAMVKVNGADAGTVGPGNMVERSFNFSHGKPNVYEVTERPATPEEIKTLEKKVT